jgi:hypothetical protein
MPKLQPPKPRLALRVGVTGHKPDHLHHAQIHVLQDKISEVLQILKDFVIHHPRVSNFYRDRDEPILRLVSSLAEGTDSYVAHQAISLGYELQCPLPFARDQYLNDFEKDASAQEFNRLLNNTETTTAILELDGSRDRAAESYLAAGRVVLSQSDVLIAIWDGQGPRDGDHTAQIVADAGLRNILTIRIDSTDPLHHIYYRVSGDEWSSSGEAKDGLLAQLRILLNPPHHTKKEKEEELGTTPHGYFSEKQRWFNWGFFWIPFRNLWLRRPTLPRLKVSDFGVAGTDEWVAVLKNSGAFSNGAIGLIDRARLFDHYGWANGLAEYYGNLYRSAFAINYVFSALAVFCAFLHYAFEHLTMGPPSLAFTAIELVLLGSIMIIYGIGTTHHWHERWIDYRLLAEYHRQLFFLIPLGPGELSSPHLPKYMSAGDPKTTWMHWHYLALRREIGLVGAELTHDYLDSVRSFLNSKDGIRGQIDYHEANAGRLEKLDARFVGVTKFLFVLAILAAISAGVLKSHSLENYLEANLPRQLSVAGIVAAVAFIATASPTLGAALAGIRSQAEFERVKKRSRAMLQTLQRICKELSPRHPSDEKISYAALNLTVAEAGQLMVDELLDWRIVFKDRPLPEPG